jgi:hypothetical protein
MSIPPGCRKARELMENSPGDDGEQWGVAVRVGLKTATLANFR